MSYRYSGAPGRTLVEDCVPLEIAELKRRGHLDHKGTAEFPWSWTWPDGWKLTATVRVVTGDRRGPRLYLKLPNAPEQMICLGQTKPNYGGVRWWLKCECGERCTKLYLRFGEREFRCRKALDLTYESQHLSPVWRLPRKVQRLRRALEAEEMSVEHPKKPKRMWFRTFQKLHQQMIEAQGQSLAGINRWMAHNLGSH